MLIVVHFFKLIWFTPAAFLVADGKSQSPTTIITYIPVRSAQVLLAISVALDSDFQRTVVLLFAK